AGGGGDHGHRQNPRQDRQPSWSHRIGRPFPGSTFSRRSLDVNSLSRMIYLLARPLGGVVRLRSPALVLRSRHRSTPPLAATTPPPDGSAQGAPERSPGAPASRSGSGPRRTDTAGESSSPTAGWPGWERLPGVPRPRSGGEDRAKGRRP